MRWEPIGPARCRTFEPGERSTYHVYDGEPIRQDLYPFANGGPVVFVPEGQSMYGMAMASGWLETDRRLTQLVKRLGGTRPPVESEIQPAANEASATDSGPAGGLVGGAAGGAVLLAVATVGWRRLRSPRGA